MKTEKYYLGLDIGTSSVGWAVTDENYNLMRRKGKDLWGVHLFEAGKTAEERRMHRTARRRTMRKTARLDLLREIFEPEILKVDPGFYQRMDESKYWLEDKKSDGKYALFNDKDYTDQDYFSEYPTIFHLRKALMEHKTNGDIRFYFLAIHQMLKRRGHFLFKGQKFENISDVTPYTTDLKNTLKSDWFDIDVEDELLNSMVEILKRNELTKTDKKKQLKDLITNAKFDKTPQKQLIEISNLLVAGKIGLHQVFQDPSMKELATNTIDFESDAYDAGLIELEIEIGEKVEVVKTLKAIYDFTKLQAILKDKQTLSDAQIERYEKHKRDLRELKDLVNHYDDSERNLYAAMFRDTEKKKKDKKDRKTGQLILTNNYVDYIGHTNDNKGKKQTSKKCNADEFFTTLIKTLETTCPKDQTFQKIKNDIAIGNFMPKQLTSDNSVIPYQVHLLELEKILQNLERDYPSFSSKQEGLTLTEKIKMIFTFRIPYYVGPLNTAHKDDPYANAWAVRKAGQEHTPVRPWNFEQVIDRRASEEIFIRRMTNKCTYLPEEDVLAKSSILYSEYLVWSELNNLTVNGDKLPVEVKKNLFEDLFCSVKNVSTKRIVDYLVKNNHVDTTLAKKDIKLGGFDETLKSSMASLIDLQSILEVDFELEMAENIIEWCTIHSDDHAILEEKIQEYYPGLTNKQIKKLTRLKYSGWARFSKKFLTGITGQETNGSQTGSILYFLKNTNDNLMQLLSQKYTFTSELVKHQASAYQGSMTYDTIRNLYVSPSVKKMIWKVIRITDEIIQVMGTEPDRIFLEMAREKELKPERKESRKNNLEKLYKAMKKDPEVARVLQELTLQSDSDLRQETLFLYFTQMGRCMYSGEPISLSDVLNKKSTYDIDHIIPRKLKKDDSPLNNTVLVKKSLNQSVKKDRYPLPLKLQSAAQKDFWAYLLKNNLITKTKYDRLVRTEALSDAELADFISRQLVETRQSAKAAADLMKNTYNNSKIVYVKAGLVSEFRQQLEVFKCREISDLHHAHDAYLNVVVGDIYRNKFTDAYYILEFVKQHRNSYSLKMEYRKKITGPSKKDIWDPEKDKKRIVKTINKPSILVVAESYEDKGQLFNATIVGKSDIKKDSTYLPLKQNNRLSDIQKYGAYGSLQGSYFFIVKHTMKKKRVTTIEYVPLHLKEQLHQNRQALTNHCVENLQLKDPEIVLERVLTKALISINGFRYTINGRTGKQIILQPAVQPFWKIEDINALKVMVDCKMKLASP